MQLSKRWQSIAIFVSATVMLSLLTLTPIMGQAAVMPPIPYPDANNIGLAGGDVTRLPMDQIVTYKALPEY
ncbi:MAG: hypothetical protein ABI700_25205, partial [Chloroflexota bacterium]